MMMKWFMVVMALMVAVSLVPAAAEEATGDFYLNGSVISIKEDGSGFLLNTVEFGEVLVHINEDTFMSVGALALLPSLYVSVKYNGAMTFSLPGQINALRVTCHVLEGTVVSVDDENKTILVGTSDFGEVIVAMPEGLENIPAVGDYVLVSYSGIIAMSIPGRVNAWQVESFRLLTGIVTEVSETAYTLAQADGSLVVVNLSDESRLVEVLEIGDSAQVLYNGIVTRSMPPRAFGIIVRGAAK